jgi:hypothetical protein
LDKHLTELPELVEAMAFIRDIVGAWPTRTKGNAVARG